MRLVLCYETASIIIEVTILYLHHSRPLESRKKKDKISRSTTKPAQEFWVSRRRTCIGQNHKSITITMQGLTLAAINATEERTLMLDSM